MDDDNVVVLEEFVNYLQYAGEELKKFNRKMKKLTQKYETVYNELENHIDKTIYFINHRHLPYVVCETCGNIYPGDSFCELCEYYYDEEHPIGSDISFDEYVDYELI